MNGGGTGTLAWRWTRTQCMGCELGHWWACLVPVEHPDLARYVGVWSAWISPKVRALNQDLTRCDRLASQKLSLLHPLARTRPRNGHLKTNRTDLVYFCSPCMSSPRLSRTVRCRMQVGNQTHFFRSWWNKFEHKRSQTYTNTAYETHMCLQTCSAYVVGSLHCFQALVSLAAWIFARSLLQCSDLNGMAHEVSQTRLWKQHLLKIAWWALFVRFYPAICWVIPAPFFLKAWISYPARHIAWPTKAKTMCQDFEYLPGTSFWSAKLRVSRAPDSPSSMHQWDPEICWQRTNHANSLLW